MKDVEEINCFPVSGRFNQCFSSSTFKIFMESCPLYFLDIYIDNLVKIKSIFWSKSSVLKLKHALRNTCSGQKKLSYKTSIVWNSLPTELKLTNSLNNFKHKLKDHFFKKLRNMNKIFLLIDAVLETWTVIFSINLKLIFVLFMLCFMLIFSNSFRIDWSSFFQGS